jgi:outer membrane receptor for ferrienterochelin and colicin
MPRRRRRHPALVTPPGANGRHSGPTADRRRDRHPFRKTLDETPIRTEVVDRQEIERTHARTLKDALENVPGLQLREIHGKSGYEVTLQGMTSDQVLILIDGLPITASTGRPSTSPSTC